MSRAGTPMIPSGDSAVCQGLNASWGTQPPGVPHKHAESPGSTLVVWGGQGGDWETNNFFPLPLVLPCGG